MRSSMSMRCLVAPKRAAQLVRRYAHLMASLTPVFPIPAEALRLCRRAIDDQQAPRLRIASTVDPAGPMGRMVLTVLGMVAAMELGFIRDRQRAGIDAAKLKGIYKGRPVTFDRGRIVSLRKEGMGATEIAKAVGCKRGNV